MRQPTGLSGVRSYTRRPCARRVIVHAGERLTGGGGSVLRPNMANHLWRTKKIVGGRVCVFFYTPIRNNARCVVQDLARAKGSLAFCVVNLTFALYVCRPT